MKPIYDNFAQMNWYYEEKERIRQEKLKERREQEFLEYKASWERWKIKNGHQDGRYPTAKELYGASSFKKNH